MNDDGSRSEKPTQRMDKVRQGADADSSGVKKGSDHRKQRSDRDMRTTTYPGGEDDADDYFTSADDERSAQPLTTEEAEETEMISRDELFRNAALDRDKLRQKKQTIPVESIRPKAETRPERPRGRNKPTDLIDETREMDEVDTETIDEVTVEEVHQSLDGTAEFARHGISMVEDEQTVEFPGRIEEGPTVRIPVDVAVEIGLEAGDLVMIEVRKIED